MGSISSPNGIATTVTHGANMRNYDEWLEVDPADEAQERDDARARRDSDDSSYGEEDYE